MIHSTSLLSLGSLLAVSSMASAADIDWLGYHDVHRGVAWEGGVVPGPNDLAYVPTQTQYGGFIFRLDSAQPLDVLGLQIDRRASWMAASDGVLDSPSLLARSMTLNGVTHAQLFDVYASVGSYRQHGYMGRLEISDAKFDVETTLTIESGLLWLRGGSRVRSSMVEVGHGSWLELDEDSRLEVGQFEYSAATPLRMAGRLEINGQSSNIVNGRIEVSHSSRAIRSGLFVSGGFLKCGQQVNIGSGDVPEGGWAATLHVHNGGFIELLNALNIDHGSVACNANSTLMVRGPVTSNTGRLSIWGDFVALDDMVLDGGTTSVYGSIGSDGLIHLKSGALSCVGGGRIDTPHLICEGTLMFRQCNMVSSTVPELAIIHAGTFERGGTIVVRDPSNAYPGMVRELVHANEITGTWNSVLLESFDEDLHVSMELVETDQSITIRFDSEKPGDVDGNGDVSFDDLHTVLSNWGEMSVPTRCWRHPADIDASGRVNISDLLILLSNYGS